MRNTFETRDAGAGYSQAVIASAPAAILPPADQTSARRTWMTYEGAQGIVSRSKFLRRLTLGIYSRLELLILRGHKNRSTLSIIRRCRRQAESLISANEAFFLFSLARAQCELDGAMAELGVYQGSSAQIICEAKQQRTLYLFDTFAGLPEPARSETRMLRRGQFSARLAAVRDLLRGYSNVRFCPGTFPESARGVYGERFSLVHLDADLYASTRAGLEFFYPRMVPGGIIIAHDYSTLPGVMKAFAEFLTDRCEEVIELPSTQAMIVVRDPGRVLGNQ